MAMNVAPYNTAMRIGQGFNSYTHEICINDAVVVDDVRPGGDHFSGDTKQISQIVTYCTRHVTKMSDVTDAMNISAALSIKSATAGGGLSGSYVDSNKFKESDINFFVQVQVVNQTIMAEDVTKFQPIPGVSDGGTFTKVYGDCFISGFVEGGELDAIISIKTTGSDTSRDIKAALEASFGKGGVGASASASVAVANSKALENSETTITVNWNGGGDIKAPGETWSIETLTKVAAAFPTNVAACPQRTYAILTKYESLRSYQLIQPKISPLDYEIAGYYTNDLLDLMMAYKNIWKDIHTRAVAFEFDQITLEKADTKHVQRQSRRRQRSPKPDYDFIEDLLQEGRLEPSAATKDVIERAKTRHSSHGSAPDIEYPEHSGIPYDADEYGLEKAKKDCRVEMLKIVKEVDEVNGNPVIALLPDREVPCINPAIFRKLLPVAKNKPQKDAQQAKHQLYEAIKKPLPGNIKRWLSTVDQKKAVDFKMTEFCGDHSEHEPPNFGSDFDKVINTAIVSKIEVSLKDKKYIEGYKLSFRNNSYAEINHGTLTPPNVMKFDVDANDKITAVTLHAGRVVDFGTTKVICGIGIATARAKSAYLGADHNKVTEPEDLLSNAPHMNWSFKGLWYEQGSAFDRMGIVYGRDTQDPVEHSVVLYAKP